MMHPRLGVLRPLVLAVGLCLLFSGAVDAGGHVQPLVSSASISPSSQTTNGTNDASWTGYWSGTAPFSGYFKYGDGNQESISTGQLTLPFSHPFAHLCVTKTYTHTLWVSDTNGGRGATSTTIVPAHAC